jgi:hypothetical protein
MTESGPASLKRPLVAAGIGVAVAVALIATVTLLAPPRGSLGEPADAAGVSRAAGPDVWAALATHEKTYLKAWRGAFTNPKPEPQDVLDAFAEVVNAVTGPGGFWRTTVPNSWFGCEAEPAGAVCQRLAELAPDFAAWDAFLVEMAAVDPAQVPKVLEKNRQKLADYLESYVPSERSLSGMKATAFYAAHLKTVVESSDRLSTSTSDEL